MPDSPQSVAEPAGSVEFLTGLCAAVRAEMLAAVGQVWRVQSGDLAEAAGAVAGVIAAGQAVLVALTREAINRGLVAKSTAVNPTAWLAEATGVEPRAVSPVAGAAALCLEPGNAPVAQRVLAGSMGPAMAVKVVREVDKLMPRLPWGFDRSEMIGYFLTLIDQGGTTTSVGELAKRVLAEYGGDALERDVTKQHDHETLSWWEEPSGMIGLRACLAADHAAVVIAGITARSAPGPQVDPETGVTIRDPRSAGKRRADALVELVTRAMSVDGDTPMGPAATLVVTVDLDTLTATSSDPSRGGHATTGENTTIDPGALRRYACDANLIPVVLGPGSAPLDVGRTKRLATREMRVALALRDRGCTFPGCDRPPAWCRAHHLIPWAAGGATALDNLVLLCERHHTIVHRDHLTATIHPDNDDGTGGVRWDKQHQHTAAA